MSFIFIYITNSNKRICCASKDFKEQSEKVKEEVKRIHKYTVPEIAKMEAEVNKEYEDWINNEVR